MNSLRHLPRRSSKNCNLPFANNDRQTYRYKENYSIDYYVFRHLRRRRGAAHGPDEGTSVAARLQGQGDTAHHPTPQVRGRHDAGDVPDAPPQHEQATVLPLQEAEPEATTRTLLGRGTQGGQLTHREADGLVTRAMAGCFGL